MKEELFSPEEAMPSEEREQYYNERVKQVVEFAYQNAPAVKSKLDKAGVKPSQIRTTRDLELIPTITRDEIIELQRVNPPYGGLLAVPVESLYRFIYSPGPLYVPLGSTEYAKSARKILFAMGLRRGDTVILSMPNLYMAGASVEDAMILDGIVCISAGTGNTELQMTMMHDLGIKGYIGTPTFLMNMVRKAEESGYNFRKDFKLQYALVWGGFHITEEQFVEIVEPETGKQLPPGEVGALLVTGFSNDAFPMIRYMTGDLSSLITEPCPCGRTSPRITGIMGRVGDSLKVRALYLTSGQVKTVAEKFPMIANYQVIVSREGYKDKLTFNLELADESIDRDRFLKELQSNFQDVCRVRVDKINVVTRGTIPEERKVLKDDRDWQIKTS